MEADGISRIYQHEDIKGNRLRQVHPQFTAESRGRNAAAVNSRADCYLDAIRPKDDRSFSYRMRSGAGMKIGRLDVASRPADSAYERMAIELQKKLGETGLTIVMTHSVTPAYLEKY